MKNKNSKHPNISLDGQQTLAVYLFDMNPKKLSEAAAAMGRKGGKQTAKRGKDYFRKIAAMRKNFRGGRPTKVTRPPR